MLRIASLGGGVIGELNVNRLYEMPFSSVRRCHASAVSTASPRAQALIEKLKVMGANRPIMSNPDLNSYSIVLEQASRLCLEIKDLALLPPLSIRQFLVLSPRKQRRV